MFTLCIIEDLMGKAVDLTTVELSRVQTIPLLSTPVLERRRPASTNIQEKHKRHCSDISFDNTFADYTHILTEPQAFHLGSTTTDKPRGVCIYCVHLFQKNKYKGMVNVCAYCSSIDPSNMTHYLCKDHFATFHGTK
eukprot:11495837-Ditylum_brightwellii.AAC.1